MILKTEEQINWFISGLVDAEGSFGVNVVKHSTYSTGFAVLISFEIGMNKKDEYLLKLIKKSLNLDCNIIYNAKDDTFKLKVSNLEEIVKKIIPFFEKYTLFSQKKGDFYLMCKVVDIVKNKEHLTLKGLNEIINIKASMNLGLSTNLKEIFPNISLIKRPLIDSTNLNKSWLIGFIEGEGCFYIHIYDSPKSKLGKAVQLVFKLTQHVRDKNLLLNIVNLLGCGRLELRKSNLACDLTVTSIKDFKEYIVPFFESYTLVGQKLYNYNDFKLVYTMLINKEHLTQEGLIKIIEIKNRMNTKRS
uniref:LAGLIDADG homing endonuclease n=1 Tax=Ophiostoma brevicolle TaxID=96393 RepID=M9NRK8_9PEZI|nr:LAGLIDADG homing endonuclease [Ophiostoma brevicolle]